MMKSVLVGTISVSLYMMYQFMMRDSETQTSPVTKKETINQVFTVLKKELRESFSIELPKDSKDGLITKEFFVKMHALIYKYKKYG